MLPEVSLVHLCIKYCPARLEFLLRFRIGLGVHLHVPVSCQQVRFLRVEIVEEVPVLGSLSLAREEFRCQTQWGTWRQLNI